MGMYTWNFLPLQSSLNGSNEFEMCAINGDVVTVVNKAQVKSDCFNIVFIKGHLVNVYTFRTIQTVLL